MTISCELTIAKPFLIGIKVEIMGFNFVDFIIFAIDLMALILMQPSEELGHQPEVRRNPELRRPFIIPILQQKKILTGWIPPSIECQHEINVFL